MLQYVNETDIFIAIDSCLCKEKKKENKTHSQIWRPQRDKKLRRLKKSGPKTIYSKTNH